MVGGVKEIQRGLKAGVFEEMVYDLRTLLRLEQGCNARPSAVILDSRTLESTPESSSRAGYDSTKRKNGPQTHMAVDKLVDLLALLVTPATNEQDRDLVHNWPNRCRKSPAIPWK